MRALWRGEIDFYRFYEEMRSAIRRAYTQAWYEGAKSCGITPEELTREELLELEREILFESQFIDGFADAIERGSKGNKGKLTPLLLRAGKWLNKYTIVRDKAKLMACKDKKLRWVRHALDSCRSCVKLEGRVYRASIWNKYNIRPGNTNLECVIGAQGVPVCRCQFAETDEPVTPGRPPNMP